MKTHRKSILVIISIIFVCLLTSCNYLRPCRYFNLIIENNVMKIGQKMQVYYELACHMEVGIYYSIEDENIIEFDDETFILTALNVGESDFVLETDLMNYDRVTIVVV